MISPAFPAEPPSVERVIARLGGTGQLNGRDVTEFQAATHRVLALMSDGLWHTREEIVATAQQYEGLRRLRDLREMGFVVETRRLSDERRAWQYRLTLPRPAATQQMIQQELLT